ncbi:hypothetical protein F5X68DRAFT_259544 [Plectosphaerella plurivora]|uniref:Uncharacterized protein n=1 Tax=Plectosphaerella plurivora TaxID=936078 RepID=A0A9P9AEG8_9PEZI|nr:hypothetical protein F5X68DRAFT_259544 [Plectosphaerella plurivora]
MVRSIIRRDAPTQDPGNRLPPDMSRNTNEPDPMSARNRDLDMNYAIGKTLIIKSDEAPPPFKVPELDDNIPPGTYPEADPEIYGDSPWNYLTEPEDLRPLSIVYNHFPRRHLLSHEPQPVMSDATKLLIIGVLSRKTCSGAQVLVCRVKERGLNVSMPDVVVVKVFDSLFFTGRGYILHPRDDPVAAADMAYAHEVAAYERFQEVEGEPDSTLREGFQPAYYGSWYHEARTGDEKYRRRTRPVRLIVMEKIDGISLADMCLPRGGAISEDVDRIYPVDVSGNETIDPGIGVDDILNVEKKGGRMDDWMQRMRVINDLADGLVRQSHMGITTNTVSPRHVIVQGGLGYQLYPGPLERPGPRVVLVDYSSSITTSWTERGTNGEEELPVPRSPRGNFKLVVQLREMCGWWPAEWRHNTNLSIWFSKTFGTSTEYYIKPEYWGADTGPAATQHGSGTAYINVRDGYIEGESEHTSTADRSLWGPYRTQFDDERDWLAPSESEISML